MSEVSVTTGTGAAGVGRHQWGGGSSGGLERAEEGGNRQRGREGDREDEAEAAAATLQSLRGSDPAATSPSRGPRNKA